MCKAPRPRSTTTRQGAGWGMGSGVEDKMRLQNSKKRSYKFTETLVRPTIKTIIRIRNILPILFLKNDMVKMRSDNNDRLMDTIVY